MIPSPVSVRFEADTMWVLLSDGRTVGVPLARHERLVGVSHGELSDVTLSPLGLHWLKLEEDISVTGLLLGTSP